MTINTLRTNLAAELNCDSCAVFEAYPDITMRPPGPFAALGLGSVAVSPIGFGDFREVTIKRCSIVYTLDIYTKTAAACLETLGLLIARAALCCSGLVISAKAEPELRDGLYTLRAEAKCEAVLSLGEAGEAQIINLNIDGRITL